MRSPGFKGTADRTSLSVLEDDSDGDESSDSEQDLAEIFYGPDPEVIAKDFIAEAARAHIGWRTSYRNAQPEKLDAGKTITRWRKASAAFRDLLQKLPRAQRTMPLHFSDKADIRKKARAKSESTMWRQWRAPPVAPPDAPPPVVEVCICPDVRCNC